MRFQLKHFSPSVIENFAKNLIANIYIRSGYEFRLAVTHFFLKYSGHTIFVNQANTKVYLRESHKTIVS